MSAPPEIGDALYNAQLFPLILLFDNSKKITQSDLILSDFYIQSFRTSQERIELDHQRFNDTLSEILEGQDELLKIRSILLIFIMKNIFNVTTIFETLITLDILKPNCVTLYSDDIFTSDHRYFNDIFFNQLQNHPLLILNFTEIIKSFVKRDTLTYEALYPIANQIILANENSIDPVSSSKLIFMDNDDITPEHKQKVESSFPIILPFNLKYEEYRTVRATGPRIYIRVNREDILSAVWSIDTFSRFDFVLKANFGEGEVDAGGPTREFVDCAFKALVQPETGLFDLRNGYYWFKYHRTMTEELKRKYRSIGSLLGIVILNQLTIPIRFPRYFYKKLLHRDLYTTDLHVFDPVYFNTIMNILNSHITEDDYLDFTYRDIVDNYEIDLTNFSYIEDPDNFEPEALVDNNKEEFVSKVVHWIFDLSVRESFQSFEEGYRRINTNPMLYTSFTIDEIDKIVSGDQNRNWDELKSNASYMDYNEDSQVIQWFWRYFDSLNEEKKLEAIKFITGSSSIPVGGLKDLNITIVKCQTPSNLPLAHTCFNKIELPQYRSYDELAARCSEAFPNVGFGFG